MKICESDWIQWKRFLSICENESKHVVFWIGWRVWALCAPSAIKFNYDTRAKCALNWTLSFHGTSFRARCILHLLVRWKGATSPTYLHSSFALHSSSYSHTTPYPYLYRWAGMLRFHKVDMQEASAPRLWHVPHVLLYVPLGGYAATHVLGEMPWFGAINH